MRQMVLLLALVVLVGCATGPKEPYVPIYDRLLEEARRTGDPKDSEKVDERLELETRAAEWYEVKQMCDASAEFRWDCTRPGYSNHSMRNREPKNIDEVVRLYRAERSCQCVSGNTPITIW